MSKNKSNSFAKNVLMLMVAQLVIKLLGLVYRLAITNIHGFGDLGNGYYSAGYQVYAVLLVLSSREFRARSPSWYRSERLWANTTMLIGCSRFHWWYSVPSDWRVPCSCTSERMSLPGISCTCRR